MKRDLLRYMTVAGGLFLLLQLVLVSGCSKMNDTYKEFLEGGPIKYIGKPDSVLLRPGKNRIQLSWRQLADPKVKGGIVFWNNGSDSAEVAVTPGNDTLRIMLESMPEGEYVFQVYSKDAGGKRSLGKEVLGRSYGAKYEVTLLSRPADTVFYLGEDTLQLNWGGLPDTSIIGTELLYTDIDGMEQKTFVSESASSSFLYHFDGGIVKFRTVYVPERKALDTFYTQYDSLMIKPQVRLVELPREGWGITASSFDARSGSSYRPSTNLLDGDVASYWVNSINPQKEYPHWVQVDMGEVKENIAGFTIMQRKENTNLVKTVEIYTSNNGTDWDLKGTYTLTNSVSFIDRLTLPEPESCQYFMIKALNDYGNSKNVCLAEIGAFRFE